LLAIMKSRLKKIFFHLFSLLIGIFSFYIFLKTGHLAGRSFLILCILEFLFSFLLVLFFPGLRFYFAAFSCFALPRAFSIVIGRDSHNILLPLFLGMTAGLAARYLLILIKSESISLKGAGRKISTSEFLVRCLFVWFTLLTIRALVDYYSPYVLTGYPVQDLETSRGVSSNYSTYLTSLVSTGFLGPLIFVMMDIEYRRVNKIRGDHETSASKIARELIAGFAAGAAAGVIVIVFQEAGIKRLFAGSAGSSIAGRTPALFTDSGASAILLPAAIYSMYLFFLYRKSIFPSVFKRATGEDLTNPHPINNKLVLVFVFVLAGILVGIHQGRGYFLTCAGLFLSLFAFRIYSRFHRRKRISYELLTGIIFLVVIAIILLIGIRYIPALNRISAVLPAVFEKLYSLDLMAAYNILDPPRASLHQAGLEIFINNPVIGTGLNSFMVETASLRISNPAIPIDNPATFFIGVLSDTGVIGLIFLCSILYHFIRYNFQFLRHDELIIHRVHSLPLMMLLPFFIGYHVIFAEFAVFLVLPFLLIASGDNDSVDPETPNYGSKSELPIKKRIKILCHNILRYFPAACVICYVGVYAIRLDTALPRSYWRHEKGIHPQLRPDITKNTKKYGKVYYFRNKRDFALSKNVPEKVKILIEKERVVLKLTGHCGNERFSADVPSALSGKKYETQMIEFDTSICSGRYPHIFLELKSRNGKGTSYFGIEAKKFKKHRLGN